MQENMELIFYGEAKRHKKFSSLLQQLSIKRTTRKILKVLQSNTFKIFLGLGLSAKRCKLQNPNHAK